MGTGKGGGGSSNTVTQNADPWSGQQPHLLNMMSEAERLYGFGGQNFYPEATYVPFSPQTQFGLDANFNRASGGSPYQDALAGYMTGSMNQPQFDLGGAGAGATQLMQGIQPGQQGLANFAPGASNGYGGFAGAMQHMGQPNQGAMPQAIQTAGQGMQMPGFGTGFSSSDYINRTLANDPSLGGAIGSVGGYVGSGAGSQQLDATAGGGFLGGNPFLDQTFDTAAGRMAEVYQEAVQPGINAQFGMGSRAGSGLHGQVTANAAGELGESLESLANSIYMPAYESERDRMVQAAQAGGGLDLGEAGLGADIFAGERRNQLGAGGLGAGLYGTQEGLRQGYTGLGGTQFGQLSNDDLSRLGLGSGLYGGEQGRGVQASAGLMAGGAQGIEGMGDLYGNISADQYRGATMTPQAYNMDYGDIDRILQGGGAIEGQAANVLADSMQRYQHGQNQPWQNLGQYANVIQGFPQGYGTQTQSTTQGGGSEGQGMIGGAMAGAQVGANFGPWGAIIGAIGGGILGSF